MKSVQKQWQIRIPTVGDLILVAVYAAFVRINLPLATHGDLAVRLLVLQETCVIALALTRRRAITRSPWYSPPAMLGWCGTLAPLLVRPADPAPAPWSLVGGALQVIGQIFALSATLSLGRSFGIVAANRGIQCGGLYQVIRHPLYAAYLLAFGGYVLAHPSPSSSIVLLAWIGFQLARIQVEERQLGVDPSYRAYAARVRFRLLPGIW
jgi:protein-S-isoprenylcysteine O-methyltransferase Ste14